MRYRYKGKLYDFDNDILADYRLMNALEKEEK